MVFAQVNYTADDEQRFVANISSGAIYSALAAPLRMEGVNLINYTRNGTNDTARQLTYYLHNRWVTGGVEYNVSEPSSSNVQVVNSNQSLKVTVSQNYTSGQKNVLLTARIRSFVDRITDYFWIEPLQLERMSTLAEGRSTTVTELLVRNNLRGQSQTFSWTLYTGAENISKDGVNMTGDTVLVFIASNYSNEGVYKTTARINSTVHTDNATSMVVLS